MKKKKLSAKKKNAVAAPEESRVRTGEKAKFLMSAAFYSDLPEPVHIEYCILGRSNVGKSSFMNHVLESGKISRVSRRPGKTSLANYFQISDDMVWVDLPGYGYAKVSRGEKQRWSKLIKDYCENRENLYGIIWLIDVRHKPQQVDLTAFDWLIDLEIPIFPIFTKSDKLNQRELAKQVSLLKEAFGFPTTPVTYTTMKHNSRLKFWKSFDDFRKDVEGDK